MINSILILLLEILDMYNLCLVNFEIDLNIFMNIYDNKKL